MPRVSKATEEILRKARFFSMFLEKLIIIEGKKGCGKTTTGVAVAYELKELFGRNVLANIHTKREFGESQYLDEQLLKENFQKITDLARGKNASVDKEIEDLASRAALKNAGVILEDATLVIDEAIRFYDSRTPTDKTTRVFGYFISQMRHYHCTVILLVPDRTQIDQRVRGQADIIVRPAFNELTNMIFCRIMDFNTGQVPKLKVYGPNYQGMFDSWAPIEFRKKALQLEVT